MKINKVTMGIKVEVTSLDSIPALLQELAIAIKGETTAGTFTKDDGDTIAWDYKVSICHI